MVTNAPRANSEVLAIPPRLLPDHIEWGNFLQVWLYLPFGRFFPNSALVALAVTIITVVASCLSAYAFARLRFPFRGSLFVVYIATLMVPPAVLVIPLFLLMSQLGWVNSYEALILPMAFSSFGTFLPLSVPVIGLLALFTFTAQWNSFLWPLIAVND